MRARPPDHVQLFDILDMYESMGLWRFTYQGEGYTLKPKRPYPVTINVSLPPSEVYGRGECIINSLGAFDATTIMSQAKSADMYVAAYFPKGHADISFVLIAVDHGVGTLTTRSTESNVSEEWRNRQEAT